MRNSIILLGCIVWLSILCYSQHETAMRYKTLYETADKTSTQCMGSQLQCIADYQDCEMGLQICSDLVNK